MVVFLFEDHRYQLLISKEDNESIFQEPLKVICYQDTNTSTIYILYSIISVQLIGNLFHFKLKMIQKVGKLMKLEHFSPDGDNNNKTITLFPLLPHSIDYMYE